jgi:hypothetical protein
MMQIACRERGPFSAGRGGHQRGILARILYPDAFPRDLRTNVRDFYTRCYHQPPSETPPDGVLRPTA